MIFYFTGTGNSLYAAKTVAEAQGDRVISIAQEMDKKQEAYHYELGENETLGFAFPVYAWAPPKIVLDFIKKLDITGVTYVFSLCTCGDEEGNTSSILRKRLKKRGISLDSAFTLKMPNNYIVGFDVDAREVEKEKLDVAELLLKDINRVIGERQKNVNLTIPGKLPALKSTVVNPLFNRFATNTSKFYADDNCTSCGLCEKICPIHTITVTDRPAWGKSCTQCLACINRCPVQAIQYGKGTAKKGRYQHPILETSEK